MCSRCTVLQRGHRAGSTGSAAARLRRGRGLRRADGQVERLRPQLRAVREDGGALQRVGQLAQVAGPVVGRQPRQPLRRHPHAPPAGAPRLLLQQGGAQLRQVLEPLAQRAAAAAGRRSAGSRGPRGSAAAAMACCRSTCVAARMRTSDAAPCWSLPTGSKRLLLQRAQQLGLQLHRQLAHLVEEAACRRGPSGSARPGPAWRPVKAPFTWPNSSLSSSPAGMAAQLSVTKGWSARRAPAVDARAPAAPCPCPSRPASAPACPSPPPAAPAAPARASPGLSDVSSTPSVVPAQLRLQQLRVLVVLLVQPLEARRCCSAFCSAVASICPYTSTRSTTGLRVRLALRAVQRQHAVAALARAQRHHHARVPRRQVQHAVEGVAVPVRVVLLGEGARAARLQRLAQRGEVRELAARGAAPSRVGQRPARRRGPPAASVAAGRRWPGRSAPAACSQSSPRRSSSSTARPRSPARPGPGPPASARPASPNDVVGAMRHA